MNRADDLGMSDRPAQEGDGIPSPSWAVPGGGAATGVPPLRPAAAAEVAEVVDAADTVDAADAADAANTADAADAADPWWARAVLAGLLVVTAVGYLWDLDRNGWGNSFYAAAVQAGTHRWTSFFYGSFDWGDYITVDTPPVSLWIMALSGRIFGFSSWSMLAPQALLGVGSVALLYAAVRRAWGAPAGLFAAALLAATPAAALMSRFNNPDAALTFLLVAAAWTLTRAVERGRTGWLLATAVLLGTAFLAKSLQAALVIPGLTLAYLGCAPGRMLRRIWQLVAAGAALVVSNLWWPLLVDAIPASSRPFIGGSTTNSVMELILGYNGLGRITGEEGGPGGGGAGRPSGGGFGGGFGGATGWDRMFNAQFGGFIAWWIPAAVIGLAAGGWLLSRRRHVPRRTDPRLASLAVWGGWTAVTIVVFSFASGIIHTYYTVALAPGVAALAGMTLPGLWHRRSEAVARWFLAAFAAATAVTTFVLLRRAPGWFPWLAWAVLALGVVAAVLLLVVRPAAPGAGPAGRRAGGRGPTVVRGHGSAGGRAQQVEELIADGVDVGPVLGRARREPGLAPERVLGVQHVGDDGVTVPPASTRPLAEFERSSGDDLVQPEPGGGDQARLPVGLLRRPGPPVEVGDDAGSPEVRRGVAGQPGDDVEPEAGAGTRRGQPGRSDDDRVPVAVIGEEVERSLGRRGGAGPAGPVDRHGEGAPAALLEVGRLRIGHRISLARSRLVAIRPPQVRGWAPTPVGGLTFDCWRCVGLRSLS